MKKLMIKLSAVVMVVGVLFTTSCKQITPQEEGFKVSNSGDYRGIDSLPQLTGINWYMPGFSYIVTVPTTMQHVVWSDSKTEGKNTDEAVTIICFGGSGFRVDVGLNYRVKPGKGSKLYLKYKIGDLDIITNTFLRNIVRGAMQDISGHITVDSMLNNLPGFEQVVRNNLSKRFDSEGLIMEGFNVLSRPTPVDPALEKAINAKIIAKQESETAKQQLQISIANANKKVADARGDSTSMVVRAGGEASANRLRQATLTPMLIQQQWIEAWKAGGSQVPGVVAGQNSQFMLNTSAYSNVKSEK